MEQAETDVKIRILKSAKRLFAKQGFEGTSVRQICEEAGANVALVSYHFGGKEKVFQAIFEHFFPGTPEAFKENEAILTDPVEGLRLVAGEIVKFTIQEKELSDIVQQELTLQSPRLGVVFSFLNPVWLTVKDLLVRGKARGDFRFESMTSALLMVFGVALSHKRFGNLEYLADLREEDFAENYPEQAVRFIMLGLGVKANE
ncbi:HTH-type transcriptional repressor NicS [compost metagenome]